MYTYIMYNTIITFMFESGVFGLVTFSSDSVFGSERPERFPRSCYLTLIGLSIVLQVNIQFTLGLSIWVTFNWNVYDDALDSGCLLRDWHRVHRVP